MIMDHTDKLQENKAKRHALLPLEQFNGTLATRVYLVLKDAILSLVYHPGEIIRKREICEILGVSRSPVSEAIAVLATEGLVDVVQRAGTFVSKFSMAEIKEGAFLREALEVAAIEFVAENISDAQLELLQENIKEQQQQANAKNFAAFYEKDAEMHELIMSFTGYKRLGQLADSAWVQVNRARRLNLPTIGRIQETVEEHQRIIDALADRDAAKARKATRDHLRQLIKYLEPLEKQRPELFEQG